MDPIVTVRGAAQLDCPPDLAELAATVHSAGDRAEPVRRELATASAAIAALLGQFEAAIERSSTSAVHVSPVFGRRAGTKVTGYRGSFSTRVVVADFDALPSLVLALSGLPNSQLDGPWWSLRPDNAIHRQVRLAAIQDARQRAADYAAAFGASVQALLEISDLDSGFAGGAELSMMQGFAADTAEPAFVFEPATQTVAGQVTVRFGITRPTV